MSAREKLRSEMELSLGGGMVDVEADPAHYDLAINRALDRYRQRSVNSMEESFLFVDMQPNVDVYTLPPEVQMVKYAYRRGLGASGSGVSVDPFSLAFTNNLYMISNPGGLGGGGVGTMATYVASLEYQELAGKLFGKELLYDFNPATHRIRFHRKFGAVETVLLHIWNMKPEEMIINDPHAKPWIRDYSVAALKLLIGEARSKFGSIAGPQGGASLNGEALKNEAKEEMTRLDEELKNNLDGNMGYGFVIG